VVENMSWLEMPDGSRNHLFGSGGGQVVADALTRSLGSEVPLLGQIPLDPRLRETGDAGTPLVLADPSSPASVVLRGIAERLATRSRGLAGRLLSVSPSSR
jgi:ATP-binding protein involved in chromosome partitioning